MAARNSRSPALIATAACAALVGLLIWWLRGQGAERVPDAAVAQAAEPAVERSEVGALQSATSIAPERESAPGGEPVRVIPSDPGSGVERPAPSGPGVRLVDSVLGGPLSFCQLGIELEGEWSELRATRSGLVTGVAELLSDCEQLSVREPDGRLIELLEADQLGGRIEREGRTASLRVECGPTLLVDAGVDRGLPLSVELLSTRPFGSSREVAAAVGEWEGLAVFRARLNTIAVEPGFGRLYLVANGAQRVGLAFSSTDHLRDTALHPVRLLHAAAFELRVDKDLGGTELFCGLQPTGDAAVDAGLWGDEWIGALAEPPSPYRLEANQRVSLPLLPLSEYNARLLRTDGEAATVRLAKGSSLYRIGRDRDWEGGGKRRGRWGREAAAEYSSETGELSLYTDHGGSPSALQLKLDSADDSTARAVVLFLEEFKAARISGGKFDARRMDGIESLEYAQERGKLELAGADDLIGRSFQSALEGDFDAGGTAYTLTAGVLPGRGGDLAVLRKALAEHAAELGYVADSKAGHGGRLRLTLAGVRMRSAAVGMELLASAPQDMFAVRQVGFAGGGGYDTGFAEILPERRSMLTRERTGAVVVALVELPDELPQWDPSTPEWSPAQPFRPLPGVALVGAGESVRTDLFGLAVVRAEGSSEVAVDLPGLAPIRVGTGQSLRGAPGLLGVPPSDPDRE